jgi:hypothetical protein
VTRLQLAAKSVTHLWQPSGAERHESLIRPSMSPTVEPRTNLGCMVSS